jgi:hypothetical protein
MTEKFALLGNGSLTRDATIEELLETMFSIQSVPRLYNENLQANKPVMARRLGVAGES